MDFILNDIKNFDKKNLHKIYSNDIKVCGLYTEYNHLRPMNRVRMAQHVACEKQKLYYKLLKMPIEELFILWRNI